MRLDGTGIRRAETAERLGISDPPVYRILILERSKAGLAHLLGLGLHVGAVGTVACTARGRATISPGCCG